MNGQSSSWSDVFARVPQGSILEPLLFLTYINDIFDVLHCSLKLFADDRSLFTIVYYINEAIADLNNDLLFCQIFRGKKFSRFGDFLDKS